MITIFFIIKKKPKILSSTEGLVLIKRFLESPANSLQRHLTVFVKNRTHILLQRTERP